MKHVMRFENLLERLRRGPIGVGLLGAGWVFLLVCLMALRPGSQTSAELLPPGSALTVRVERPLTSQNARIGDFFEARVVAAEVPKLPSIINPGARVKGRCVAVRAATEDGRPGYLRLALFGLWDAQGRFYPLETTSFSLLGNRLDQMEQGSSEPAPQNKFASHTENVTPTVTAALPTDVVVTPDADLTFVLLKSAGVAVE